jgi:hypothetical protein
MVYAGTDTGYILALNNPGGTLVWAVSRCPQACRTNTRGLAALSADGALLFVPVGRVAGVGYAGVLALSTASGATVWTLATNDDARSVALDSAGTLFVGDASGFIIGVHSTSGAVVWTYAARGAIANLAIGANGALYATTNMSLIALR